ncbi:MAG TPA: GNAT family N-acetyltransferase [Melioribacteraceae bacterium]|nr:GNAT family N-acetyltransferase [Melioribacteraceae bacterium]
MLISKIDIKDYKDFFDLLFFLDNETNNRAYEPGERDSSLEVFTNNMISKIEKGDIIILAKEGDELIGYIEGERGTFRRNRHVIHFNIAIKLLYTGKGVGAKLIKKFEKECENYNIERIELTVFCDNDNAVKLYKKMGYTIEGTKINSFKVNGIDKNEYLMAKSLKKH